MKDVKIFSKSVLLAAEFWKDVVELDWKN